MNTTNSKSSPLVTVAQPNLILAGVKFILDSRRPQAASPWVASFFFGLLVLDFWKFVVGREDVAFASRACANSHLGIFRSLPRTDPVGLRHGWCVALCHPCGCSILARLAFFFLARTVAM
jgi:hypothetical protein